MMITSTTLVSAKSKLETPVDDLERILRFSPSIDDDRQVDWLQLPDSLLSLISDKLVHFKDYIRFGAVCKPWHSIYIENRHQFRRKPQLPLLMLPTQRDEDGDYETRSLFSLTEKTICNFQPPVHYNLLCPGSCYGWVATVSPDLEVSLLNPFAPDPNKNTINLPPLAELEVGNYENPCRPDFRFLHKVVLSADPATTPNYVVMAVYGSSDRLAFFKPGDDTWTSLPSPDGFLATDSADLIYYAGKFHSVDSSGTVDAWDINHKPPKKEQVSQPLNCFRGPGMRYIVESSGHLLQVIKHIKFDDDNNTYSSYSTVGVTVCKLDPISFKWIRIRNLQGHSLFLGDSMSLSLLVSDFPECKPDSIYYTDDFYGGYHDKEQYRIGPHDMGVFSVKDGTIEKYYPTESKIFLPAPIWIQPTLSG